MTTVIFQTYIKYYQDLYPEGKAEKFCNQIFEKFDIDKNGKIVKLIVQINADSNLLIKGF